LKEPQDTLQQGREYRFDFSPMNAILLAGESWNLILQGIHDARIVSGGEGEK
jgi:hypothetical protein